MKVAFTGILFLMTIPMAEGRVSNACGAATNDALYSGVFKWNGDASDMKIVLAKAVRPGFTGTRMIAKLMKGSTCQAICGVQRLETDGVRGSRERRLASVEMACKSTDFGALSAPATLFLRDGITGRRATILRFGTWLQGYQQAEVRTEIDRSARLMKEMREEPVQLAQTR